MVIFPKFGRTTTTTSKLIQTSMAFNRRMHAGFRYSISSNSWEALANTTADQGEGDAMTWVDIDSCIYATIGAEQRPTYFTRYDPLTDSWSDAPADPPAGIPEIVRALLFISLVGIALVSIKRR